MSTEPRLQREKDGCNVLRVDDGYLYVCEAQQVYRWWTNMLVNPLVPLPDMTARNRCVARTELEARLIFTLRGLLK